MEITQDPKELMKMAGLKTVAEVYRTLDKLSIRKEYHEALLRHNMDLDFIVSGIKGVALTSEEDTVKLNAYKTLLKSLGLEDYKENEAETKENWEDLIRKNLEENKDEPKKLQEAKYEVIEPVVPEEEIKRREEDKIIGESLYESK